MACFIAPGRFLLKKRKKTEPLSLFPPLTSRQVSFRLWPYVEVIYFEFDFGILHRVFDLHGWGVDRGVSALYAAGQRHQPASAADFAAVRRGEGADDSRNVPVPHRQHGPVFHPRHRGDAGISGCAEAAGHPLSGGDAGVHAGGLRGDRVEHPALYEDAWRKGGRP